MKLQSQHSIDMDKEYTLYSYEQLAVFLFRKLYWVSESMLIHEDSHHCNRYILWRCLVTMCAKYKRMFMVFDELRIKQLEDQHMRDLLRKFH